MVIQSCEISSELETNRRHHISPARRSESLTVTLLAKRAAWGDDEQDTEQTTLLEFGEGETPDDVGETGEWVLYATNIEGAEKNPTGWAKRYARRWVLID